MTQIIKTIFLILLCSSVCFAKKTQSARVESYSPEKQRLGFKVPEGFVVELVASEKDGVINPIDLKFDDEGRLWTQTARMYPLDPFDDISWGNLLKIMNDPQKQMESERYRNILEKYQLKQKGEDQILVISNLEEGNTPKISVWADGLSIPQSVLPYKNGAYVAHGAELIYFEDRDLDGQADHPTTILKGFGITDTHTMSHTLERAPGGWINFSQGALCKGEVIAVKSMSRQRFDFCTTGRFSLDGMNIELLSNGLNNIWGYKLRANGKWYGAEANDFGMSITPIEDETKFKGIGDLKQREYQPVFPILHDFRVGGTGIAGMAMYDDDSGAFPSKYKHVGFLANPITNSINAVRIVQNKNGEVKAEHLDDFLTSEDDWFRPINMEFGPDGCLYVIDFYNKVISHNEVKRTHPDRDRTHGRIWRIRYTGHKNRKIPNVKNAVSKDLIKHLQSPYLWEKRAAWHQIVDRKEESLIPVLKKIVLDVEQDDITRIHALWSLEGLDFNEINIVEKLANTNSDDLRREAVRASTKLSNNLKELTRFMKAMIQDSSDLVRSQVIRSIMSLDHINYGLLEVILSSCEPTFMDKSSKMEKYRYLFNKYISRKALEKFNVTLNAYLNSPEKKPYHFKSLSWAIMALPKEEKEKAFLDLWENLEDSEMDEATFVAIAPMFNNPVIFEKVASKIQNSPKAVRYPGYALTHRSDIQSSELVKMITPIVLDMLENSLDLKLALNAIQIFKINSATQTIIKKLPEFDHALFTQAIQTLKSLASKDADKVYLDILSKFESEFSLKLIALQGLVQAKSKHAKSSVMKMMQEATITQKQKLVKAFTSSKTESSFLLALYKSGDLNSESFDLSSAEMLNNFYKNRNIIAKEVLSKVRKRIQEEESRFQIKLTRHLKIAESGQGDPDQGKLLFTTCLMCHQVGKEGQNIAPPLDGSAHRETEALLTAILDPNAAFEGNFNLFRVNKHDNSSVEGYQVKINEKGVTLAFMGGAKVFIPKEEIKSSYFVPGRSFMPSGLIDSYSDDQVANLLAYIRTLK